jgi:hypothetical protein
MARILRTCRLPHGVAIALLLAAPPTWGQTSLSTASQTNPQTVVDILHQMSDSAGVIFAGQVLAIRRPASANPASGIVEIEFRVDQAIRGCSVGTPYVLREWSGLWVAGNQRYRVGQRLLMLLHAPGAAGISSPVGGLDGAIPIRQGAPLAQTSTPTPPFVDLRWLGVRLPHAVSYRIDPVPSANTLPQMVQRATSGSSVNVAPIVEPLGNTTASEASVPTQQASVATVFDLLTTWQKAQNVAP